MVEDIVDSIVNNQSNYKIQISTERNPDIIHNTIENIFTDQNIEVSKDNIDSNEIRLLKNDCVICETPFDKILISIIDYGLYYIYQTITK